MRSISKIINISGSYPVFFGLMAVLLLGFLSYGLFFRISFWSFLGFTPSVLFTGLLFINRLLAFVFGIKERRYSKSIFSFWFIVLLCGIFLNYLYRVEGMVVVNPSDRMVVNTYLTEEGPLADTRDFFVKFEKRIYDISARKTGEQGESRSQLRVYPDGAIFLLKKIYSLGYVIKDSSGKTIDRAFVVGEADEPGQDYFRTPVLPHRFYLKPEGDGFRLKITRGKFKIRDERVKPSQEIEFEGLRFSVTSIEDLYLIRILHLPGNGLAAGGSVLSLVFLIFLKLRK